MASTTPEPVAETIWKFALPPDFLPVSMPRGSQLLYVAEQHGALCLWAQVDPTAAMVPRRIYIVGTGHDVPGAAAYVGSALLQDGMFVFHVYDGGEL
jgi:hypothetical protein